MSPRPRRATGACALALLTLAAGATSAADTTRRPRVGLALGGGSARGIAHVGVLQWLEEHHVPVDAIAGTSTGAFIGGAYATGLSAADIQRLLREADWELMLRPDMPYALKSFRRKEEDRQYPVKLEAGLRQGLRLQSGLNSGHRVGLLLSRVALPYSTVESFDDLPIPFRCVATDLQSGQVVVLERGPLGPAMRASMAIPGTYDPVPLGGRPLSDGGILNNLPVDVVRALGVDVVIAVSVEAPPRDTSPEGFAAVARRAIDLMMENLAKPQLRQADVVIRPDMQGVRSSDFRRNVEIAALGYAAAEAQRETLLRYALGPEDWQSYTQALQARRRPSSGPMAFVEVDGVSKAAAAQIAERLEPALGKPFDPVAVDADLDWLVGTGRYSSAMYRRLERGDQQGLGIDVRDKSYAPPFVRFSLDLDNENRDVNLTLGSRINFMDATGLGSEWRIDTALGSTMGVSTELIQPLRGSGPVRRGAFVAPRAFYSRTSEDLYSDGELIALEARQRVGAGLDAGWVFGRSAELRAGYEAGHASHSPRVGDALPRSSGPERSARLSFAYEGQDRAHFPTRGVRFVSKGVWMFRAPDAPRAFGRAEGALSVAWRVARRHHATVYAEGGTSFGGTPPRLYEFSLGGPFRLAAYPPHAERGPKILLGGLSYRHGLAGRPNLLYERLYLMVLGEVGSVFERTADAQLRSSFSAGLAADTLFGPLFVGASVGSGGRLRAYFVVGSLVR